MKRIDVPLMLNCAANIGYENWNSKSEIECGFPIRLF
jgi:hypothetical protein